MAFQFGGGSSGGGGASGGWSAPLVYSPSASAPQQQKKENKNNNQPSNIGGGGSGSWGGGSGPEGGITPDGTWSVGFHGIGPPAAPSAEARLFETLGSGLSTIKLSPETQAAYQKYLDSIDISNIGQIHKYNQKLVDIGADTSLFIGDEGEKRYYTYLWNEKYGKPVNLFPSIYEVLGEQTSIQTTPEPSSTPIPTPVPTPTPGQNLFNNQASRTLGKDNTLFSDTNLLNPVITKYTSYTPADQTFAKNAYQKSISDYNALLSKANILGAGKTDTIAKSTPTPVPTPTQTPKDAFQKSMSDYKNILGASSPVPTPTLIPNAITNIGNKIAENIVKVIPQDYVDSAMKNVPVLVDAMIKQGMTSANEVAYGIATAIRESGLELVKDEIRANPNYERALYNAQNNYSGGWKYHGRGPIQLTHDYNYKTYGDLVKPGLGDKLVANPDLANEPDIAAALYAAYLKESGTANVAKSGNFYGARKYVNQYDYGTYAPIANQATAIKNSMQGIIMPTPAPTGVY